MYKKLLTGALSLAICSQGLAQDYRAEGHLDYISSKDDAENEDSDILLATGTYYFSPVKTQSHPLAEAAFLERNSSLTVSLMRDESSSLDRYDFGTGYFTDKADTTSLQAIVGAETYLLDDFLYLAGYMVDVAEKEKSTYTSSVLIYSETETRKYSNNMLRLNLGIAPLTGLLVWTELDENTSKSSSFNLSAKYLLEFSHSALNIQGGLGKNSFTSILAPLFNVPAIKINFYSIDVDIDSAYILGDYYFGKTFSLGMGVSHLKADFYDYDDMYMIRAQKFFGDNISVRAGYAQDKDEDNFNLGMSLRF